MPSLPTPKTRSDSSSTPTARRIAGWAIIAIMLAMFILPFTVFREVNTVYGSFAVFTVGALVVIGLAAYLTRDWK